MIQSGIPRLLGVPEYNTKVVVDSYLSSDIYGKYYTKYKKAGDKAKAAIFAPLYRQHASATVTVKGEKGADPTPVKQIKATFQLKGADGAQWIKATNTTVDKDSTAGDVVEKMLKENKYTYEGSMNYISGITTPAGVTLAQMDKGPNSGWMYRVNGVIADKALSQYVLQDGDQILLFYTNDYTKEPAKISTGGTTNDPVNTLVSKPSKVTKVKIRKSKHRFVISWKKVKAAKGYQVVFKASKHKKFKNVKGLKKLASNKYKTKKYSKGKTYWYKVRAYKIKDGKKVYGA